MVDVNLTNKSGNLELLPLIYKQNIAVSDLKFKVTFYCPTYQNKHILFRANLKGLKTSFQTNPTTKNQMKGF